MIEDLYISREHLAALHNEFPTDMDKLMLLSEECAELIQSCQKMYRGLNSPITNNSDMDKLMNSLTEEMAHVLICIEAVSYEMDIKTWDVQNEIHKKEDEYYESTDSYPLGPSADRES